MTEMEPLRAAERLLPAELLGRASLCENEYAWPICDIPRVIEAARQANLLNIGGQLQFQFPNGATCECYWVEVDTYKAVSASLPWAERVTQAARVASSEFSRISEKYDFIEEGRRNFDSVFRDFESAGYSPLQAMCFVWYVDECPE